MWTIVLVLYLHLLAPVACLQYSIQSDSASRIFVNTPIQLAWRRDPNDPPSFVLRTLDKTRRLLSPPISVPDSSANRGTVDLTFSFAGYGLTFLKSASCSIVDRKQQILAFDSGRYVIRTGVWARDILRTKQHHGRRKIICWKFRVPGLSVWRQR